MNKRACKVLLISLAVVACLLARTIVTAQQSKETQTEIQKNVTLDQARHFSAKFERGSKVTVDNRTTGRITVVGWDKDQIEATATSERGVEAVNVDVSTDSDGTRIFLKADYADYGDAGPGRTPAEARRESLKARLLTVD